jgi:hypothetical protein
MATSHAAGRSTASNSEQLFSNSNIKVSTVHLIDVHVGNDTGVEVNVEE